MNGITLLTIVTLVYVAILVLALAVALITISIYLWRIRSVLAQIRGALVEVAKRTAPLPQHLKSVEQLTEQSVLDFEHATTAIERAVGIYNEADLFEEAAAGL